MCERFYKEFRENVLGWLYTLTEEQGQEVINLVGAGEEYSAEEFSTPYNFFESVADYGLFWKYFGGYMHPTAGILGRFNDEHNIKCALESCWEAFGGGQYSFLSDFFDTVAYKLGGYESPESYFEEVAYGGCASAVSGWTVYDDENKCFYIEHIDDLEAYFEDMQQNYGAIKNEDGLRHYTLVCWRVYEDFCRVLRTSMD